MSTTSRPPIDHLGRVNDVSRRLAERGVVVYEHNFQRDADRWTVVAGQQRVRLRIDWDGADATLTVREASTDSPATVGRRTTVYCIDESNDAQYFALEALLSECFTR